MGYVPSLFGRDPPFADATRKIVVRLNGAEIQLACVADESTGEVVVPMLDSAGNFVHEGDWEIKLVTMRGDVRIELPSELAWLRA